MRFALGLTAALAVAAASYAPSTVTLQNVTPSAHERDVHSFARPTEARVTHVALDLAADFKTHRLSGTVVLTIHANPFVREIVLDMRELTIDAVTDGEGRPLAHELARADPILGRALHVTLFDDRHRIVVRYATSGTAAALQWLTPVQT